MTLKVKLNLFSATLIYFNTAFSAICPDINDIKAEGLSNAALIAPQIYADYQFNQFNTAFEWGFILGYFENMTQPQALTNGNLVLSNMTAPGVPDLNSGRIVCNYETGQPHLFALAVRDIFQLSALKLPLITTS